MNSNFDLKAGDLIPFLINVDLGERDLCRSIQQVIYQLVVNSRSRKSIHCIFKNVLKDKDKSLHQIYSYFWNHISKITLKTYTTIVLKLQKQLG
jgi:hypothetical protein